MEVIATDLRMRVHASIALPVEVASALERAYAPFNLVLGRLIGGRTRSNTLPLVRWLRPQGLSWRGDEAISNAQL